MYGNVLIKTSKVLIKTSGCGIRLPTVSLFSTLALPGPLATFDEPHSCNPNPHQTSMAASHHLHVFQRNCRPHPHVGLPATCNEGPSASPPLMKAHLYCLQCSHCTSRTLRTVKGVGPLLGRSWSQHGLDKVCVTLSTLQIRMKHIKRLYSTAGSPSFRWHPSRGQQICRI